MIWGFAKVSDIVDYWSNIIWTKYRFPIFFHYIDFVSVIFLEFNDPVRFRKIFWISDISALFSVFEFSLFLFTFFSVLMNCWVEMTKLLNFQWKISQQSPIICRLANKWVNFTISIGLESKNLKIRLKIQSFVLIFEFPAHFQVENSGAKRKRIFHYLSKQKNKQND